MPMESSIKYSPVDSDSEKGEHDGFLGAGPNTDQQREPRWMLSERSLSLFPWILIMFFAALSLYMYIEKSTGFGAASQGTYEVGFETDIITASRIPLERVTFSRSPTFDINGTATVASVDKTQPWPEDLVLFGPPSPEIDANWEAYIGNRYFSLTKEEITRAVGAERIHEFIDQRRGGYSAGLDLFHTLHCLNSIRRMLHPDYYKMKGHSAFHTEHCLDAIRRHVQCYGSTTLIPTRYWEGLGHNYIDTDQTHTCRSFKFLREYTNSRMWHGDEYVERDMSLVDPEKHRIALQWHKKHRGKHGHGHV